MKLNIPILLSGLFFISVSLAEEPAASPGPSLKNTLKWTTASEVNNFGYDVYRGETENGPFIRLNSEPIQGAGTVDTPSDYSFIDQTIEPNKAYFYYVESICMDGVRERFTPVFRSIPKTGSRATR